MEDNATVFALEEAYGRVNRPAWVYFGVPLWIFGTLGNILTLIVMLRKRMRSLNVAIYLITLVVTDLLVEMTEMFPKILHIFTGIFLADVHIVFCKTLPFVSETSLVFSSWVTVAISFERMLCVRYPLWSSRTLKMSNRVAVVVGMLAILSFVTGVKAYWRQITYDADSDVKTCFAQVDNPDMLGLQLTIYYTFYSFIPALILFISSVVIGYALRNRFLVSDSQQRNSNKKSQRTDDTIRVLACINMLFFLTTVPFSILNYLAILGCVTEALMYALGFMDVFIYVSNSVNFLLYVFSGRVFRNELRQLSPCFPVSRDRGSGSQNHQRQRQHLYIDVEPSVCNTQRMNLNTIDK